MMFVVCVWEGKGLTMEALCVVFAVESKSEVKGVNKVVQLHSYGHAGREVPPPPCVVLCRCSDTMQ
jgi:hypothetical protein